MKTLDPREYDVFSFTEELYDTFFYKKKKRKKRKKKKDELACSKIKEIQSNVIIRK